MFHPTLKLNELLKSELSRYHFSIVQIGAGGNGGYLTQRLSKLLYSIKQKDEDFSFSYKIVDGDIVERHNLLRQPFIEDDLHGVKSEILAERYQNAYNIPILYSKDYMESVSDIERLYYNERKYGYKQIPILIGCVDNNATRQIMHQFFDERDTIIYIDTAVDAVFEGDEDSGYSGQVVCGVRLNGHEHLAPVGKVYSNILQDKDTFLPSQQACGITVVNHPQRMQTNETAALIANSYLNNLLTNYEIVSHYTNFNAKTMNIRPTYLKVKELDCIG